MILVKPSFEIWTLMDHAVLKLLERAGRTCYKSGKETYWPETRAFIERIIKSSHESVIEHFNITVKFIVDRGVTHELVRHRLASYSQESTRYCNYSGGVTFVIPPWIDKFIQPGEYIGGHGWQSEDTGARLWFVQMTSVELDYRELIEQGWSPQQARSILPNSTKTEIICTANLREWRHILKLRTSKAAHPQMQEIMIPLLAEFKRRIPVIFDDIKIEGDESV